MERSFKKPELLAPAGSFDSLRADINAGADAVYMGGSKFGARAYADNPDETGMLECIEFCHLRNRKISVSNIDFASDIASTREENLSDGKYSLKRKRA